MSYPGYSNKVQGQLSGATKASSKPIPKPRPQRPPQFDPEELSRRLYVVLAEQQARAARKGRGRSEGDKGATQNQGPGMVKTSRTSGRTGTSKTTAPTSSEKPRSTQRTSRPPEGTGRTGMIDHVTDSSVSESSHAPKHEGKAATDGTSSTYRHVPQVAATQFAQTATASSVDDKTLIHKLSQAAMKFHLEGPNASEEISTLDTKSSPTENARQLRRAQSKREKQYERNHVHNPPILELSFEFEERQDRAIPRQTFETHFKPKAKDSGEDQAARRLSTGSGFRTRLSSDYQAILTSIEKQDSREYSELAALANEHRVDWTQSDEIAAQQESSLSPQLRKSDSKWTLRGRLGSFHKAKDDRLSSPVEEDIVEEGLRSPKSPRAGFFSRFKR